MFENAKQLACYCGVAPFSKSSGTSVRHKPGISPFANRKLKSLLHLCAMAALRWDKEIKTYYERKVAEGKNKMSVINAIRNKLLQRIFAVIRDQRPYTETYQYKCAGTAKNLFGAIIENLAKNWNLKNRKLKLKQNNKTKVDV